MHEIDCIALPETKSLGKISSENTSVHPIHFGVEHLTIALYRVASLGAFWWEQIFDSVSLDFAQFMSSHAFRLPGWYSAHKFWALKQALV